MGGIEVDPIKAHLHLLASEVDGSLEEEVFELEGVGFGDATILFQIEEFIVGRIGWQETNAFKIKAKPINGFHPEGTVGLRVVAGFQPIDELAIEGVQRRQIKLEG